MDLYKKYYLPEEYKTEMLKKAIIIFDTSALLDLYYYSHKAQDEIFNNVFEALKDRLWIPAQVHFEFLKNKSVVSEKPILSYRRLIEIQKNNSDSGYVPKISNYTKEINTQILSIKNQLKTLKEQTIPTDKHPNLSAECYVDFEGKISEFDSSYNDLVAAVNSFSEKIKEEIENQITNIQQEMLTDRVESAINRTFVIGPEYGYTKMYEIAKEGAYRYVEKIPPGYEDKPTKEGLQKYGDLYVWMQILDYAEKQHKDVLLITNDTKPDWHDEALKSPRFELLKEFYEHTKCFFWSYNMKNFLYHINSILDAEKKITNEVLEEAVSIQEDRTNDRITDTEYDNLVKCFLSDNIELLGLVDIIPSWRVFGKIRLYEGLNNTTGRPVLIMINFARGSNYTSLLHPVRNIFTVKSYYDEEHTEYEYYQITLAKSYDVANALVQHLEKKNIKKRYYRDDVKSYIGYISENKINIINSNLS